MTGNLLILILFSFLIAAKCDNTIEYYIDLLDNFLEDTANWEYPTDSRSEFTPENDETTDWGEFDFIVAGAGVGGSVLANRLTETGKFKVLVLEAGGFENDFSDVPGFVSLLLHSEFNWGYKSIPQKTGCLGFVDKKCNYPRGKVVGGSSVINYILYIRGSKEDYNRWGTDNPGWDYESLLPYFLKCENSSIEIEERNFHGHDGLLNTESCRYYPEVTKRFLRGASEMGNSILDYNGDNEMGFSRIQMMTHNGRRCSAGKAYVKPVLKRENLQLLDHALATKVLIQDKKAYGLEFIRNGKKYRATSSKEVILSSGTFNSAQLLLLSGIGPKEHLEELNIEVVQDLPVGKQLHDHFMFPAIIFSTNVTTDALSLYEHVEDYLNGYGLLTAATAVTGIGFSTPRIKSSNPSIEYLFYEAKTELLDSAYLDLLELTEENWMAIERPLRGKYVWALIPILLHPKSVGSLKLQTNDPLDFPSMDTNIYSDSNDDDLEEMLSAVKEVFAISKTAALQSINSQYVSNPFPACSHIEHLSDDYWRCVLKLFTFPIMHPIATCRMGPGNDQTTVVDHKLKVHGVEGLRVVDASIMPFSISAHPTAGVFVVGEKGADMIREEHGDL